MNLNDGRAIGLVSDEKPPQPQFLQSSPEIFTPKQVGERKQPRRAKSPQRFRALSWSQSMTKKKKSVQR